jgi:hypothetical protein
MATLNRGIRSGGRVYYSRTAGELVRRTGISDPLGAVESIANQRIQVTDKAGSKLTMDGVMGHVIIRSSGKVLVNP